MSLFGGGKKNSPMKSIKRKDIEIELEKLEQNRVMKSARLKADTLAFDKLVEQGRKANEYDKKEIAQKILKIDNEMKRLRADISKIDLGVRALNKLNIMKSTDDGVLEGKIWEKILEIESGEMEKFAYEKSKSEAKKLESIDEIAKLPETEYKSFEDKDMEKILNMLSRNDNKETDSNNEKSSEYAEAERRINDLLNNNVDNQKTEPKKEEEKNKSDN